MTAPTPYEPPDGHIICRLKEVPREGWEFRFGADSTVWHRDVPRQADSILVEARPVRQPDPKWLRTDLTICQSMTWTDLEGRTVGVTSVGEMRGRTDLDQWEYADTCSNHGGGWFSWAETFWTEHFDDNFPVIVRRVS